MKFLVETPHIDGEALAEEIQSEIAQMLQVFNEEELAAFSVAIVEMEVFSEQGSNYFPRFVTMFGEVVVTNFVMFDPVNLSAIAAAIVAGYLELFKTLHEYNVSKQLLDF